MSGHNPVVLAAAKAKLAADERALSLMLPQWKASIHGGPVAVFDACGTLLGLAPDCAIGDIPNILVTPDADELP